MYRFLIFGKFSFTNRYFDRSETAERRLNEAEKSMKLATFVRFLDFSPAGFRSK